MKPQWIKWYPVQWLHSTARDEMTTEQRATFQDFVCLSAVSPIPGQFKFVNNNSLARQLNTKPKVIKETMEICLDKKRITIHEDEEGFICKICKWNIYQAFKNEESNNVNDKDKKGKIKLTINDIEKRREVKKRLEKNRSKIISIISYFNERTGKNFSSKTKETQMHINGRLEEGYTIDDFKKVIDKKASTWKRDPKMQVYLRPSTLFRPTNFENYLNESIKPKESTWGEDEEK